MIELESEVNPPIRFAADLNPARQETENNRMFTMERLESQIRDQ